ncbi:helix-turn-helix domain-containing protein [Heyndrickxia acidicola]|uniref:Helix-turn-helix transcriptional regulator n=1 Tax=Heyndrickxia acidicola TaxID=209389 RepID=A0ABU6MLP2_9BACI|nr:helix-turn-helix transcriptional regulator [Heyndrickxia acidicola]MED1205613.1 helix-turn-helix transcriptional regulator [Heyndrickxia acidicola]
MFAQRMRELRKTFHLTQQDVADHLGKAKSTVAGYEKGVRRPKLDDLNKLADLFNTSTDYILGITDDKAPNRPTKDLAKILRESDYHYNGQFVSNDDLEFLLRYLDRVIDTNKPTIVIKND